MTFDPSGDFTTVTDGLEAVVLLRRGRTSAGDGTAISHALRRVTTAGEADVFNRSDVRKRVAGGGRYTAADVVWHLPAAELADPPEPGDAILDAAGRRWTILDAQYAALGSRWKCNARNIAIAYGLDDTIAVLKAVELGGDPPETAWRTWRTGVRARIQPGETTVNREDETPLTTRRYRIFVEENLDLDHTYCLRGADGTIYTIVSTLGAERIGELQVITAERRGVSGE